MTASVTAAHSLLDAGAGGRCCVRRILLRQTAPSPEDDHTGRRAGDPVWNLGDCRFSQPGSTAPMVWIHRRWPGLRPAVSQDSDATYASSKSMVQRADLSVPHDARKRPRVGSDSDPSAPRTCPPQALPGAHFPEPPPHSSFWGLPSRCPLSPVPAGAARRARSGPGTPPVGAHCWSPSRARGGAAGASRAGLAGCAGLLGAAVQSLHVKPPTVTGLPRRVELGRLSSGGLASERRASLAFAPTMGGWGNVSALV